MNKKTKSIIICIIIICVIFLVLLAMGSYFIYHSISKLYHSISELPSFNPHLKTAAVSFIDDFCYSDKAHYQVLDVDEYGRVLYFCNYNKADFECYDADHVYGFAQIVQISTSDSVGCYEGVSYVKFDAVYESGWIPGEDLIDALKEANDWNTPLNESKIKYVEYVDVNYYG